jgi:hypothetical protein
MGLHLTLGGQQASAGLFEDVIGVSARRSSLLRSARA